MLERLTQKHWTIKALGTRNMHFHVFFGSKGEGALVLVWAAEYFCQQSKIAICWTLPGITVRQIAWLSIYVSSTINRVKNLSFRFLIIAINSQVAYDRAQSGKALVITRWVHFTAIYVNKEIIWDKTLGSSNNQLNTFMEKALAYLAVDGKINVREIWQLQGKKSKSLLSSDRTIKSGRCSL